MVSFTENAPEAEYVPDFFEAVGVATVVAAEATADVLMYSCTGALNSPVESTAASAMLSIFFFMMISLFHVKRTELYVFIIPNFVIIVNKNSAISQTLLSGSPQLLRQLGQLFQPVVQPAAAYRLREQPAKLRQGHLRVLHPKSGGLL